VILYFALVASALYAQNNRAKNNFYLLKGKVISKKNMPPHCGTVGLGTVLELEIISFTDRSYTDKSISLVLTSP
jgi:hypothetical protein